MKYCIGCIHMRFEGGDAGYYYSELTQDPGRDCSIFCAKGHWNVETDNTTQLDFERYMETAERCPDFSERPPHSATGDRNA